jgi:hypothetical protein
MRTTWTPWPRLVPIQPRRPPALAGARDVIVTFIGHSTFLIQTADGNVLTITAIRVRCGRSRDGSIRWW